METQTNKRTRTEEETHSKAKEEAIEALIGPSTRQWNRLHEDVQNDRVWKVLNVLKDNKEWRELDKLVRFRIVLRIPSKERDNLPGYKYKKTITSTRRYLSMKELEKEEKEFGLTGNPYYDLNELWERAARAELFQYEDYSEIPFTWQDVIKNNLELFKTMWEDENNEDLNKRLIDVAVDYGIVLTRVEDAIQEAEEVVRKEEQVAKEEAAKEKEQKVKCKLAWDKLAAEVSEADRQTYRTLSEAEEEKQYERALAICGTSNVYM